MDHDALINVPRNLSPYINAHTIAISAYVFLWISSYVNRNMGMTRVNTLKHSLDLWPFVHDVENSYTILISQLNIAPNTDLNLFDNRRVESYYSIPKLVLPTTLGSVGSCRKVSGHTEWDNGREFMNVQSLYS